MKNKFVIRLLSLVPCILLGLVAYQWFIDPSGTAAGFGISYDALSDQGKNSIYRDYIALFSGTAVFCLFSFLSFRASWLVACGLIYLIALGLNIYHVLYHGSEVTSQLFVEVVLSIWILGTAILMKNASTNKVVKEPKVDTE